MIEILRFHPLPPLHIQEGPPPGPYISSGGGAPRPAAHVFRFETRLGGRPTWAVGKKACTTVLPFRWRGPKKHPHAPRKGAGRKALDTAPSGKRCPIQDLPCRMLYDRIMTRSILKGCTAFTVWGTWAGMTIASPCPRRCGVPAMAISTRPSGT